MNLSKLADLPLTYAGVGATSEPLPEDLSLPEGYDNTRASARIGSGRDRFEQAADALMHWGMQRGAGLRVDASSEVAEVGAVVLTKIGPIRAPCRVVYLIDEPDRRGFAVGTLPGHPVSGEERFAVRYDPAGDAVYAEVSAFSRPATWWSKAGSPVASRTQRIIANRYLNAL